jgi:SagB-type dehydrogenase family enzyme
LFERINMQARTSSALVFARSEGQLLGYNFLQKQAFECGAALLEALDAFESWSEADRNDPDVSALMEVGALVEDAGKAAALEQEFLNTWNWGIPAAMMHFSVQENEFLSSSQIEEKQIETASHTPSPPLYLGNEGLETHTFENPLRGDRALLDLMSRRRSNRDVGNRPVSIRDLSEILFSGMGITGFTQNCVGTLPLKMTPSGGARNPYEAYVVARNVEGLAPGIYHYSALEHSLGKLKAAPLNALGSLVGGQEWADQMACVIFLSAFMDRTMWKYDDPNAYRVVLIEAGHIGQNMMLVGTEKGITVCPTAALSHEPLFNLLELPSRVTCAPIYALALGYPSQDGAPEKNRAAPSPGRPFRSASSSHLGANPLANRTIFKNSPRYPNASAPFEPAASASMSLQP